MTVMYESGTPYHSLMLRTQVCRRVSRLEQIRFLKTLEEELWMLTMLERVTREHSTHSARVTDQ